MFEIDKKKFDVSIGKNRVGIYKVLLHPTSHAFAESLLIVIEIKQIVIVEN